MPNLERALLDGEAFALSGPVEMLETHISWLFFVGPFVFKVKKPVALPFLDYSTIELRRRCCEEEVRLGRRFAGDVYCGVAPIVRGPDGRIRVGEGEGEVIDHAVKMRRLPATGLLDRMLDEGRVDNGLLERVLDRLARFEREAARGESISRHGEFAELSSLILGNLEEAKAIAASSLLTASRAEFLHAFFVQFLASHREMIDSRVRNGRIREGHGDLHAGNLCDLGDRIVAYDCIEFEPRFRCLDPAAEIAFLAMDIEARGYPAFGAWLVKRAGIALEDPVLTSLVPLYFVHYAIVRAKVAMIRGGADAVATAQRYFDLATSRALPPLLILTCGLPASGKSTFSAALAQRLHATVLRSDVVRKELHGMSPSERSREGDRAGIYTQDASDRLYDELLRRALERVSTGHTVIVDAAFPSRERRTRFVEGAKSVNRPIVCAHVIAEESVARERLERRAKDSHEPSDADLSVYLSAKARFDPPVGDGEFGAGRVFVVDSTKSEETMMHDALESLATCLPG